MIRILCITFGEEVPNDGLVPPTFPECSVTALHFSLHYLLVAVAVGGVNVPVAGLEGVLYCPSHLPRLRFPGA